MESYSIFKLKHDLYDDSEIELATFELRALAGYDPEPVANLVDLLSFPGFVDILRAGGSPRLQDVIMRLPYCGSTQALAIRGLPANGHRLVERLSFFRDFFFIGIGASSPHEFVHATMPSLLRYLPPQIPAQGECSVSTLAPYAQLFSMQRDRLIVVLRLIPLHTFYECSDHVGRLGRRIEDVDRMFELTKAHFVENFSRPFVPSVGQGFKWIEDFIDDRRAPNAYATHSYFGLRGRFFPRMVHAVLNHLDLASEQSVYDPFCGVGTLSVEAALMGIRSISSDINPLFVRMAKAKERALHVPAQYFVETVSCLLDKIQAGTEWNDDPGDHLRLDFADPEESEQVDGAGIPRTLARGIREDSLAEVRRIRRLIQGIEQEDIRLLAEVPLAYYMKSMLRKYSPEKVRRAYWGHLWRMVYAHRFLSRCWDDILPLRLGNANFAVHDVRELSSLDQPPPSAIVTSPPYTTAIDYVGNDSHALYLLELTDDHHALQRNTIGSSRARVVSDSPFPDPPLPASVAEPIAAIARNHVKGMALMAYYNNMWTTWREMAGVLEPARPLVLIIGSEQEMRIGGRQITLPIAQSMVEMGEESGFTLRETMRVKLAKTKRGAIVEESILVFSREG